VLAARSGALTETVRSGETGLVHTPGDPGELADHVLFLEKMPEKRRSFGRAGRQWLLANTREDEWRRRFLQIFEHATRPEKDRRKR
jgi:glycosyltransferase involved in cell wall biosynthesis